MPDHDCRPGLSGRAALTVGEADTAAALGSGDVAVLATPRVLALAEQAAVAAVADCLPAQLTSVGSLVELRHLRPNQVGDHVAAHAVLDEVSDRTLRFTITVRAGDTEVASVRHERAIVERARFPHGHS